MLCLLCEDVTELYDHLILRGHCTSEATPSENPGFGARPTTAEPLTQFLTSWSSLSGIYNALLRDPDGYLIELQMFTDPVEQALFSATPS